MGRLMFAALCVAQTLIAADGGAQSDFSIGADGAGVAHEFGEVGPVLLLANGALVVADLSRYELVFVPANRSRVQRLGRYGRGPREFLNVSVVASLSDREVVVLDVALHRATILELDGDSLRFADAFESRVPAHRACGAAGQLVIQGEESGHPLQLYRREGRALVRVRGTGREPMFPDDPPNPMLRSYNQIGIVGCGAAAGAGLAWAPVQRARVQIVLPNDSVREYALRAFEETRYESITNGLRVKWPASGVIHHNRSLLWAERWVVGSISRSELPEQDGRVFVRTIGAAGVSDALEVTLLPVFADAVHLVCVAGISDEPTVHVGLVANRQWRRSCGIQ